jgi:Na+/H+ antiporter NhaD/arsenite permease-like protein
MIFGIQLEFYFFAIILLLVAIFSDKVLISSTLGLVVVSLYKIFFTGFHEGQGFLGFLLHCKTEWVNIVNLLMLLVGFELLSDHFSKSNITNSVAKILPESWVGGFILLVFVFFISSFLDNIAAAIIGATIASNLFNKKVHIGYLASIVAASNAGGSGSVVGDTTTTMMWIAGISPAEVFHGYIAAIAALIVSSYFASRQQHTYQPIIINNKKSNRLDWSRIFIVFFILVAAIWINLIINLKYSDISNSLPFIGMSIWAVLILTIPLRKPKWSLIPGAFKGSLFLLALIFTTSLMPVENLPKASSISTLGVGFLSAFVNNIPLTSLAIKQGNYDWGMLAYCIGYGGSMIWFGSSAGVAVVNLFPKAKSTKLWLKDGWHVTFAYIVGYIAIMLIWGWHPTTITK